jgi:SAM-dependent methyltransferase/methyltransferase-like protein
MPARSFDYDLIPYSDSAYAESHPERLAAIAHFARWNAPALDTARVLEIGCARGGNLLPMAASMPRATFVGVDSSAKQIDEARAVATATKITNVSFHHARFEDVPLDDAAFDYVIAHGIYSWVSPHARRALLRRMCAWLAPSGVAYASLNTLPGWYARLGARDWLRFATANLGETLDTADASLAWLHARASSELATYRHDLARVRTRVAEAGRVYVAHEYLEDEMHPELVSTFLREAADAGLAYAGDSTPSATALELLDDETRQRARALDVIAREQLVDFVKNTAFRRALLVRADTANARGWTMAALLDPSALDSLRLASRLRPATPDTRGEVEQFDGANESVHVTNAAARAALHALAELAPRSLAFEELCKRAATAIGAPIASVRGPIRSELFDLWLATYSIDVHAREPRFAPLVAPRPQASPLARWRAAHGGTLTNMWHQEVLLADDLARALLPLIDGTRTVDELAEEARRAIDRGMVALGGAVRSPTDNEVLGFVRASLQSLALAALLV